MNKEEKKSSHWKAQNKMKNMAEDFNSRIQESEGKIEIRVNLFLNTDLKIIKEK